MKATYTDRIRVVFEQYQTTIALYVVQLEILLVEFPVEILNEVRAIFTHLARVFVWDKEGAGNDADIDKEITGAERHTKRAILDCYKYLCLAYQNEYETFTRQFENVDLSYVDNGDFLPELLRLKQLAEEKLLHCRKMEIEGAYMDEELFECYEAAYIAYANVKQKIDGSLQHCETIKVKTKKAIRTDRVISILGVIGTVAFGLLSIYFYIKGQPV